MKDGSANTMNRTSSALTATTISSSILSSAPNHSRAQHKIRRAAKSVPHQMLEHCNVLLEEKLYPQALALLDNALTAGLDTRTPAAIPPAQHLALVVTLSVHPAFTTRTLAPDKHLAARDALRYLRHVVSSVDAKDAGLRDALQYTRAIPRASRPIRARTRPSGVGSDDDDLSTRHLNNRYVDKNSLWHHAEDFWAVVGWAFNCSVKHKPRWERWKPWLELMLDVLDADLEAATIVHDDLHESLIAQYLATIGQGRNNKRRIMRAITADGSTGSLALFGEVWPQETKPPKKEDDERPIKKPRLDLENDDYGDYLDNSDDESGETRKRRSKPSAMQSTRPRRSHSPEQFDNEGEYADDMSTPTGTDDLGGTDSVRLRQRCLSLLARVSELAPSLLTDTEDLFTLFSEFIRPLPLAVFQHFVLPLKPYLSPNRQASLNENVFRPLIGSGIMAGWITQEVFEQHLAPQTATSTTARDNAKVGLLTESFLRALWTAHLLTGDTVQLQHQVEKGIRARSEKVAMSGRRKAGKQSCLDEEARESMECSAQRMRILLGIIMAERGD